MKPINKSSIYPQKRDTYFDNVKGKLILLVVLGHLLEFKLSCPPIRFIFTLLYSFTMPAFCFISGLFFSPKLKNIVEIFLYYVFSQFLLLGLTQGFPNICLRDFLTPVWTLWYLLCLFYWYIICTLLKRIKIPKSFILFSALILSLLCGFFKIGYFLSVQRACAFFVFFALGLYLNKEDIKKAIENIKNWKLYFGSALSVFVLYTIYQEKFLPHAFYNGSPYYYFRSRSPWDMLEIRLLQFALSFIFGAFLLKKTSRNKNFYTWCGYYSLGIYIVHTFILYSFKIL